jgi:endonuclease/exonuclease/phosphatase (EEP) superfamily protein YafD
MSLAERIVNARTFLANFSVPCAWIAAIALLAGGAGGWKLTQAFYRGATAEARRELAEYRSDVLAAQAKAAIEVAALQRQSAEATAAAIERAREALSGEIALASDRLALEAINQSIEELHHDVRYACRQLPLPDSYLQRLRIPPQ